jgi:hypothetical protein
MTTAAETMAVLARGWSDRPGIGRFLRWIDRFLP